jgi:hypothetical protein
MEPPGESPKLLCVLCEKWIETWLFGSAFAFLLRPLRLLRSMDRREFILMATSNETILATKNTKQHKEGGTTNRRTSIHPSFVVPALAGKALGSHEEEACFQPCKSCPILFFALPHKHAIPFSGGSSKSAPFLLPL